ncbi:MAG TPA: AI-2E family transporter [Vicinamibacterales bacterium]|nr:AI-2E family transporter [Vicinamibacterales bacterium]
MAIDVRSTTLTMLAAVASVGLLWWAQAVFIPIFLAVLISHALEPVVGFLERHKCPRALGTFVVLGGVVAAVGYGIYALGEPTSTFIDQMPMQARRLRVALESNMRDSGGTIDRVKQAANEIEKAATTAAGPPPAPAGVQRVRVEEPPFRLGDLLWRGSRGLLEFLASIVVVFFLTYYLLLAGDLYRRKLASIAGPSLSRRRLVLRILLDVDDQIRRYLIARLAISLLVAVATWGAMAAVGLNQAVMWGVVTGILNVVPYAGPLAGIAAVTLAAFAQFGGLAPTAVVAGLATLIAFVEGNVVTPRLTGRAGGMNAVSIFGGILFWGWLWGVWGMLLAVPLMTALKAICSHIDDFHAVAALLSE